MNDDSGLFLLRGILVVVWLLEAVAAAAAGALMLTGADGKWVMMVAGKLALLGLLHLLLVVRIRQLVRNDCERARKEEEGR